MEYIANYHIFLTHLHFHFDFGASERYVWTRPKNQHITLNLFRNIFAAILALVIASPICCCNVFADQTTKAKSCCSSSVSPNDSGKKNPDHDPTLCECSSKQPKDTLKGIIVPTDLAIVLPAPSFEVVIPIDFPEPICSTCAIQQREHDTPGTLLAKYSRWLI